jgi:hypothetical protein
MNTTTLVPSRLLRRVEAAQYIQNKWGYPCSPRTLAKYAVVGGGPPFRKAGRYPLYSAADLDEWVSSKLSPLLRSTSDVVSPSTDRGKRSSWAGREDGDSDASETSTPRYRRSA